MNNLSKRSDKEVGKVGDGGQHAKHLVWETQFQTEVKRRWGLKTWGWIKRESVRGEDRIQLILAMRTHSLHWYIQSTILKPFWWAPWPEKGKKDEGGEYRQERSERRQTAVLVLSPVEHSPVEKTHGDSRSTRDELQLPMMFGIEERWRQWRRPREEVSVPGALSGHQEKHCWK